METNIPSMFILFSSINIIIHLKKKSVLLCSLLLILEIHIVRNLMTQVTDCMVGHRVATVNVNGSVFLAVEHDGFVVEYNISNGATR